MYTSSRARFFRDNISLFLVLSNLPDLQSLRSALLASPTFRDAFEGHPRTIFNSVTRNSTDRLEVALELVDLQAKGFDGDVTWRLKLELLLKNRSKATELERLFVKSQTKRISKPPKPLLPDQSFAFHRAIYRIWIYALNFWSLGPGNTEVTELSDVLNERRDHLSVLCTSELLEIASVYSFLERVCWSTAAATYNSAEDLHFALAVGPGTILRAYRARDFSPVLDKLSKTKKDQNFLWAALESVLDGRADEDPQNTVLVYDPPESECGRGDSCHRFVGIEFRGGEEFRLYAARFDKYDLPRGFDEYEIYCRTCSAEISKRCSDFFFATARSSWL